MNLELMWTRVLETLAIGSSANAKLVPDLEPIELGLGVLIGIITLWMFVKGFEVFKMVCGEVNWKSVALGAVPDKGWKDICKVCGKSCKGMTCDGMCKCGDKDCG